MAGMQIQGKMDALKKRHPNSTPRSEQISALAARNGPHAMLYLTNGDTYQGEWKNDKKHGTGILDGISLFEVKAYL